MDIQRIGVVGAGTMGSGIAEVAAVAGFAVRLRDSAPGQIERSQQIIRSSLDTAARRGKLPQTEVETVLGRIDFGSDITALGDCDFVVEAIVENADAKCRLFVELGRLTQPEIVLASNTSSISITKLGESSGRPDRFIGMHFFNPVPIMPLVEVVRGRATSEATVVATEQLARRMGKTPVRANDAPGFVANRVLMPMINEAIYALADGVADAASIDQIMVLGCNHPMGPLALADLIGLDVCLFIMEVLERDTGDPKFQPCPLLRKMVADGRLGRKTKRGFFDYP
jgi:3-hydroxybutyryl-CoA dehydrogenase